MSKKSYWDEAVEIALADVGITLTPEQLTSVGGSIETSYENFGMSRGYDRIPNPLEDTVSRLERQIQTDRTEAMELLRQRIEEKDRVIHFLRQQISELRDIIKRQ